MSAFYLTFVATLLAGFGARDQLTVAGLSLRQGRRPAVLVVAMVITVATAAAAAYLATIMLAQLPPPARTLFAALALGIAGLESLVLAPRNSPREPTNSLGALMLVLLARQAMDAARFLVFGMGVGMAGPWAAGAAGALAGFVLMLFAWRRPELLSSPVVPQVRRLAGALLLVATVALFLQEFALV